MRRGNVSEMTMVDLPDGVHGTDEKAYLFGNLMLPRRDSL